MKDCFGREWLKVEVIDNPGFVLIRLDQVSMVGRQIFALEGGQRYTCSQVQSQQIMEALLGVTAREATIFQQIADATGGAVER